MNVRAEFEKHAKLKNWQLTRSPHGYYDAMHVEYAFIGFCFAHGVDHVKVP